MEGFWLIHFKRRRSVCDGGNAAVGSLQNKMLCKLKKLFNLFVCLWNYQTQTHILNWLKLNNYFTDLTKYFFLKFEIDLLIKAAAIPRETANRMENNP